VPARDVALLQANWCKQVGVSHSFLLVVLFLVIHLASPGVFKIADGREKKPTDVAQRGCSDPTGGNCAARAVPYSPCAGYQ